jgi:multidrug efflux pump subunit AcrA (membrane-fusion protein)
VAALLLAFYAWRLPPFASAIEATDDAYVRGNVTIVAPKVDGYVAEVSIKDFEHVTAGKAIVRLDDRNYRISSNRPEATCVCRNPTSPTWNRPARQGGRRRQRHRADRQRPGPGLQCARPAGAR